MEQGENINVAAELARQIEERDAEIRQEYLDQTAQSMFCLAAAQWLNSAVESRFTTLADRCYEAAWRLWNARKADMTRRGYAVIGVSERELVVRFLNRHGRSTEADWIKAGLHTGPDGTTPDPVGAPGTEGTFTPGPGPVEAQFLADGGDLSHVPEAVALEIARERAERSELGPRDIGLGRPPLAREGEELQRFYTTEGLRRLAANARARGDHGLEARAKAAAAAPWKGLRDGE